MRHYVAVQDANGRWFYANEGRHRETGQHGWTPAGACSPRMACPDCDPYGFRGPRVPSEGCGTCKGDGFVAKPDACQGHDTEAEAYEHEKQRLLATSLQFIPDSDTASTQRRCKAAGCNTFTSGHAYVGSYRHWPLCAEHRTREAVEPLLCVGESWES